jgi:dCMP deaminase
MDLTRLSREEYYMRIVDAVRLRSTCDRGKVGAILVKDGRVLATGYAGSPSHSAHCDDVGHEFEVRYKGRRDEGPAGGEETEHCVRTVHAELNALLQAARYGPPVEGATLYCSAFPCRDCAKALVNSGIKEVIAERDYQTSADSKAILSRAHVPWSIRKEGAAGYGNGE